MVVKKGDISKQARSIAHISIEFKDLNSFKNHEKTFNTNESVHRAFVEQVKIKYISHTHTEATFYRFDTFDNLDIPLSMLDNKEDLLNSEVDLYINMHESTPLFVSWPKSLIVIVQDTPPFISGQTVTSSYKVALISKKIKVMVPQFLKNQDKILINPETLTYIKRANDA
ncbi:MAG: elongation factor P, C-terminal family protein [Candidatus Xenolissoclinum pacificiensis L6]|uniref:Elongation factor P, C-terminal family protein n=1 Tax=Candidatus Xenolissoclinum pacificiensis L6 TaxID=1401685 RepID=W2UZR1_9RICK|nr:MAG: elongation factor P, C-terminal family protein [Candidatus Xenolissoclinum pacificiensis L6]